MNLWWKAFGRDCRAANMVRWIKQKTMAIPSEPRATLRKNKTKHFHSKVSLEMQLICLLVQLNCLTKSHVGLAALNASSPLCSSRHFFQGMTSAGTRVIRLRNGNSEKRSSSFNSIFLDHKGISAICHCPQVGQESSKEKTPGVTGECPTLT